MGTGNKIEKKRIILPMIDDCISGLVRLSEHAAKLEYHDNEQASLRLKREFVKLKNGDITKLHDYIIKLRENITQKNKKQKP